MNLPYFEIYYGSTQSSALTALDGFGVRTHTEGLPKMLIDKIKDRNLFFYDSGSKTMAGSFDLSNQPDLVLEYPKTYAFFKEEMDGENWFVFLRTVFIGKDYGWYLAKKEESARSGNTFTHAIIFNQKNFTTGIAQDYFQSLPESFLPKDYRNHPDNPELRKLLTNIHGEPKLLAPNNYQEITTSSAPLSSPPPQIEESITALYDALQQEKKLIVVQQASQTIAHLNAIKALLPKVLIPEIDYYTNYHDYNLDTNYRLLFLNEYYQRDITYDNPHLHVCDYSKGTFVSDVSSDFFHFIRQNAKANDWNTLHEMNQGFDNMLTHWEVNIDFNQLFYAWLYLFTERNHTYKFSPEAVIRKIKSYPLSNEFRNKIHAQVIESFEKALKAMQHQKVADSLNLIDDLDFTGAALSKVKTIFTAYFFTSKTATELFKYTSNTALVFNLLNTDNISENWFDFVQSNKLSQEQMEFFVLRFALIAPELFESVVGYSYENNRISKTFNEKLYDKLGEKAFYEMLEKNDYFIFMEEKTQTALFKENTIFSLQKPYREGRAIDVSIERLEELMDKKPFFNLYFDSLAELVLKEPRDFISLILLLEFYTKQLKSKYYPALTSEHLEQVIMQLMKYYSWFKKEDFDYLYETVSNFSGVVKKNYGQANSRLINTAERLLTYTDFMIKVLRCADSGEVEKMLLLKIEKPRDDKGLKLRYLKFLLGNIPIERWSESELALKLLRYLHQEETFRYVSFIPKELNLTEFIPLYYTQLITQNKGRIKSEETTLFEFFKTYTKIVWALAHKKKDKKEEERETMFTAHTIKSRITNYLKQLKETHKSLPSKIIAFYEKEGLEEGETLIEKLQTEIIEENFITSLLKKITNPFKKK